MINSRTKGHNYEREVVKLLRGIFPNCERSQEGDSLDRKGVDLRGTGSLLVQCKRGRKYCSVTTLKEVQISVGLPVVITKADRERSVVIMYADDFIKILDDLGVIHEN